MPMISASNGRTRVGQIQTRICDSSGIEALALEGNKRLNEASKRGTV